MSTKPNTIKCDVSGCGNKKLKGKKLGTLLRFCGVCQKLTPAQRKAKEARHGKIKEENKRAIPYTAMPLVKLLEFVEKHDHYEVVACLRDPALLAETLSVFKLANRENWLAPKSVAVCHVFPRSGAADRIGTLHPSNLFVGGFSLNAAAGAFVPVGRGHTVHTSEMVTPVSQAKEQEARMKALVAYLGESVVRQVCKELKLTDNAWEKAFRKIEAVRYTMELNFPYYKAVVELYEKAKAHTKGITTAVMQKALKVWDGYLETASVGFAPRVERLGVFAVMVRELVRLSKWDTALAVHAEAAQRGMLDGKVMFKLDEADTSTLFDILQGIPADKVVIACLHSAMNVATAQVVVMPELICAPEPVVYDAGMAAAFGCDWDDVAVAA